MRPQPVRSWTSSSDAPSSLTRRATSSKASSAHSHRVMAGAQGREEQKETLPSMDGS